MKKYSFYFLIYIYLVSVKSIAQCNCQTNYINEHKIKQCVPSLVAFDKNYQIGLSLNEDANNKLLLVTIRFLGNAKTIASDLMIFTSSEKVLNLHLIDSQKDYVGESEICHAKFEMSTNDIKDLSLYNISALRFNFTNEDIKRTFSAQKNNDIIIQQLGCLTKR